MNRDPLAAIGNTPLAEIPLPDAPPGARFFAKLEFYSLTGSLKDRIVHCMIARAEAGGRLQPGQVIVEATSGNTGISLAAIGRMRGYGVKIAMPETMSVERRHIMAALGAELILTSGELGSDGAIAKSHELAQLPGHHLLGQFENPDNVLAHYETTGVEILRQMPQLDTFIAGIGTGGTVTGVARRLREEKPEVKIVGIDPYPQTRIQGLRCTEMSAPPIMDFSLLTEHARVADDDAFGMTRRLARKLGLFVGLSSGAVMVEALRQAQQGRRCIVGIFADDGSKYLSTGVFGM